MPITRELENLKKFESAGFSHEQAETLTDVIEKSHVDSQDDLREFFRNELSRQIGGLDNKIGSLDSKLSKEISNLDNKLSNKISDLDSKLSNKFGDLRVEISDLRVEISRELKDLLIKIFGIIVGTVGVAVTILKLFP